MDRDSLIAIAEDLQYLCTWDSNISNADIRRGSAILRRLLVENAYCLAWRAIGRQKEPKVIAVDLEYYIHSIPPQNLPFALSSGAEFRGLYISGMVILKNISIQPEPPPPLRENGYPGEREYYLSEYLTSKSGIVGGEVFTRRDVIKYIANIKGGVHISLNQKQKEQKLINRMKKTEKNINVFYTDGLLVEIVAIAQALGSSGDARFFIRSILGV